MIGETEILIKVSLMMETVVSWIMNDEKETSFSRGYNQGSLSQLEILMRSEILNECLKKELI